MTALIRIASSLLLIALLTLSGLAQSATISGTITTYVGPQMPVHGAQATTQLFDSPFAVISDGAEGFYFTSIEHHKVYRVVADGTLRVIAGTGTPGFSGDGGPATAAQLNEPAWIALDAVGALFISDGGNSRIRRVSKAGIITTVAGAGTAGFSGDGGPATSAQLNGRTGIAVDASGNLFIGDSRNRRIRRVTPDGIITTVAGTGTEGFSGDGGPATSAQLSFPAALALDATGNLFIRDSQRIRKMTPAGIIATIVGNGTLGSGGDGGPAVSAQFFFPAGIALDAAGNLFIADTVVSSVRRVTPAGIISTVVGSSSGFRGDGGPATSARLETPNGLAVDAAGNLFIADTGNDRIRKVAAGIINTVAGGEKFGFSGDGGPATAARLLVPSGVTVDASGNLFIADAANNRIRKVTPAGVITTVAGNGVEGFSGDGGPATAAQLLFPFGVTVDAPGNLFIADTANYRIRKVTPAGVITTVAGNGVEGFSGDGGPATSARLDLPTGVAIDVEGNLFIADYDNCRIRKVTPAGIITTVAGGTGGCRFSGDGGLAVSAGIGATGVAVDATGNLFLADDDNNRIRKVTPAGIITTVAGNGTSINFSGGPATSAYVGDGGPATSAYLSAGGVAVDATGNLYIADYDNNRIRKVTPAGIISTVAGAGLAGFGGDGGPATSARLDYPASVGVDTAGNVFIADSRNSRIRKVTFIPESPFSLVDRGGVSLRSSGTSAARTVGYARIQPNAGSTTPSGLAIFGFTQNGVLVSEAGVPASPAIQSGRIYAEINGPVNTGLAIANPNGQPATVSFYFTDSNGNSGNDSMTIPANGQTANFLNEPPFNGPSFLVGSFTFSSSVPISIIALRGLINERGEFLITTLPVVDLGALATASPLVFPHFADGGGWTTQVVLVNPGDSALSGSVQFLGLSGASANVSVNGQSNSGFTYSIPARGSQTLRTSGAGTSTLSGSVRVVPAANTAAPSGLAIFSLGNGGTTVAEAGVPAVPEGIAFRLYAEASGDFTGSAAGSIQTGLAVTNTSPNAAIVTLELTRLDGTSIGLTGTLNVPANGQVATFLNQVQGLGALQTPFQGVLRVSSPSMISVVGLRGRYNERNDFLITTTPPVNEATPPSTAALYFPHIADSGGYTTQFILFSGQPGQSSSGTMKLFSQAGGASNVTLTSTVQ